MASRARPILNEAKLSIEPPGGHIPGVNIELDPREAIVEQHRDQGVQESIAAPLTPEMRRHGHPCQAADADQGGEYDLDMTGQRSILLEAETAAQRRVPPCLRQHLAELRFVQRKAHIGSAPMTKRLHVGKPATQRGKIGHLRGAPPELQSRHASRFYRNGVCGLTSVRSRRGFSIMIWSISSWETPRARSRGKM